MRDTRRRPSPSSRSGPNSASPHHDAAIGSFGPANPRARYRRHAGRVRLGHHPDPVGDRRRPDAASGRAVPPPFDALARPRRPATTASAPASPAEAIDAAARRVIDAERLRRRVLPSNRARHRPRRARGAIPRRWERTAARDRVWLQRRTRDLLPGRVRRTDRGHRGLRRGRPDRAQRRAPRADGRLRLTAGLVRRATRP